MFKADKARELSYAEIVRKAEEKTAKHEKWLNTEVSEKIEASAKKGGKSITVTKPTNLDSKLLVKMLELNGYTVDSTNSLINIYW